MPRPDADYVVFFIGDQVFTKSDLGDELLDEDLRTVFQTMIDRGMVRDVAPGTVWYDVIHADNIVNWSGQVEDAGSELLEKLIEARQAAEKEFIATLTPESRSRFENAAAQVRMARKLTS